MSVPQILPPFLDALFRAVLQASWQGSLAIALVLLARRLLGTRVPARWHYLLWFLVLARLLVPAFVLPRNPASLENIPAVAHPFEHLPSALVGNPGGEDANVAASLRRIPAAPFTHLMPDPAVAAANLRKPFPWWGVLASVWLAGAVILGGWLVACTTGLHRRLQRDSSSVEGRVAVIWQLCCQRWLGRTPPPIRAAGWVDSPALLGFRRPILLIPRAALETFSDEDWEHVFAHEIAHLRRGDHWSQLFVLAAWCAHWFNPVVWIGFRRLRADRELAADEWVLQRLEEPRALAYGETLFKTLANRPAGFAFQPGMVGISEDGAQMKQRLRRIAAFLPRRVYGSLIGCAAVLVLGTVVLGQSSSTPEPAADTKTSKPVPVVATPEPAPVETRNRLYDELLAAARTGDTTQVARVMKNAYSQPPKFNVQAATRMLDDLVRNRELPAFTALHDELKKTNFGKDWKINDALLSALVADKRTDFLDVLLARRLELDRLSAPAKSADPATAEWIARRVVEVTRQRADIEALERAASDGDLPAMGRLISAGADVNGVGKDDNTPLLRAVFKDRLDAAQLLLDHGALVDKPRFPGWDYTPLCLCNSAAMAELLKKAGADIHAKLWKRETSILFYNGKAEVVAWFLQQGLDPRMIGDNNKNLLFGLEDGKTAELLLRAGVDPNHVDEFGNTPICYARSAAVAQALIDHGAKLTDLPEPLLPRMVSYGFVPAGALEAALKAGADHDAETVQEAFERFERMGKNYPHADDMRRLLLAHGAKPVAKSDVEAEADREILCKIDVSTEDGALTGDGATRIAQYSALTPNGGANITSRAPVESDGTASIWIRPKAVTASLVIMRDGYAPLFLGPFSPPTREQLDGHHFTLTRGLRAAIQTVDEAGQPVAGAKLKGYYPGPPLVDDLAEVVTNAAGAAVLEHVGAVPLNIRVSAEGYQADEAVQLSLDPAVPYRWMLKKSYPLPGVITAAATGQPIEGAKIKLAGVRGPHDETHSDPNTAPLLTISGAQGRFTLASLRPDSRYYLFVEASGYGGVFLEDIRPGQPELKIALGPELTVHGKVLHISPANMHRGEYTGGYDQFFKIGDGFQATGQQIIMRPKKGEAEFTTGPLYAWPVGIVIGNKEIKLEAKDLPKTDVVIDLAPETPAPIKEPAAADKKPDKSTALLNAKTPGEAEALIAEGADVNAKDKRGDTPLMHYVSQRFHVANIVRVLLKHGADPNLYSPYWKCPPLAQAKDADTVDALVEAGADVNAKLENGESLLCSIGGPRDATEYAEALLRHGLKLDVAKEGGRLMWLATARDETKQVRWLLDKGVDANAVWYTEPGHVDHGSPLGTATSFGRTEMAKLLLDHGAKVDGEMEFAMSGGHKETVRMMWERGIRTTSELAYAVSQGAPVEELARLIDSGIPADPPQDKPWKPLALAVGLGDLPAAELLLARGAKLEEDDGEALNEAVRAGHDKMVAYLVEKGAKVVPGLMITLGTNSHPYNNEQPEENFNRIAGILIKAGALENIPENEAAIILRATVHTRNPGGNPVILKMLLDHGLKADARYTFKADPADGQGQGDSDNGKSLLDLLAEDIKEPDGGNMSPATRKVIEEAGKAGTVVN